MRTDTRQTTKFFIPRDVTTSQGANRKKLKQTPRQGESRGEKTNPWTHLHEKFGLQVPAAKPV